MFKSVYSQEIASENAKNCRRRQPHYRLTPPAEGTPSNIRMNLIMPESRLTGLHFLLLTMWVYLHSNFRGRLADRHQTLPYARSMAVLGKIFGGLAPRHLGGNNG